jgi:hypothetical protein
VSEHRYLGLELSGAKNQKTSVAALEYYPKEKKIFLLDIYEKLAGDEALLELIGELTGEYKANHVLMAVNVPLSLPPCMECVKKTCPMPRDCSVPAVKWMRSTSKRFKDSGFTPYTQRPIELWVKHHLLRKLPESHRFEIDETLGGNKAPLTLRMQFLKRHLAGKVRLVEAWPKLTVAMLAQELGISRRVISGYRSLEQGAHAREEILESLAEKKGIFIYERDMRKLAQGLSAFDAFICALTALLSESDTCEEKPHGFPDAGWVAYPSGDLPR